MLSFQHLQDNGQIPSGSFTVINGKLYLDIGTLIGEPVSAAGQAKVVETSIKLMMAAYLAQTVYNLTALVGQRINSFSEPMTGTNQPYPNLNPPGYYGTIQCTIVGLVPADIDNVVAVLQ